MSDHLTLSDGRSKAHAMKFAKLFEKAVRHPHQTNPIRQIGYGPASFDIAYIEDDGRSSGRFVRVTIESFRDVDLAEKINRELT